MLVRTDLFESIAATAELRGSEVVAAAICRKYSFGLIVILVKLHRQLNTKQIQTHADTLTHAQFYNLK